MVAEDSKTYAQILNAVVHWIFTKTDLPEWDGDAFVTVDITDLSPMPKIGWKYDGTTFTDPTPPAPIFDLTAAKTKKIDALNSAYVAANLSTFDYNGRTYNADQNAQNNLNGTANYISLNAAFPPGFQNFWLDIDGAVLQLPTIEDFKPLFNAFAAQGAANINKVTSLIGQVQALPNTATQTDLDAIKW